MCYSADAIRVNKENPSLKYLIPVVVPRYGQTMVTENRSQSGCSIRLDQLHVANQVAAQICQRLGFATPNRVAVEQLPTSPQQSQLISARIDTAKLNALPLGKFDSL